MDNSRLNELGLAKVCRACLSDKGEMKPVFRVCSDSEVQFHKMFEDCTSLQVNEGDGLPGLICITCELRLVASYNFREQCQRSHATVKKYIQNVTEYNVRVEKLTDESLTEISIKIEYNNATSLTEDSDKSDNDVINEPESNEDDEDDTPLITRKEAKNKTSHFSSDVVNQAIIESRKSFEKRRECRLCGFMASNARGLSLHISHLHKELKQRWCHICYKEVEDLSNHIKEHSNSRLYNCTFCGKSFSSRGHLTEHFRSHSMDRPFKCKICNKGFLSARHLKVHDRIHSGEKPYSCQHCGRRFTQKGSLVGHIRIHTGLKPYQCDVCEKKCTTSSALALHRNKTGHVSTTKVINSDSELNIHTKEVKSTVSANTEHNSVILESAEFGDRATIKIEKSTKEEGFISDISKLYEIQSENAKESLKKLCNVCGKTFTTASKLRLHMRVHTGETPYKCQYCEKRFSTRGQLVVHVRTHTGERPHVCHVCDKAFAQSSVLNTHMKLHTGRPEQCKICQQRFCRPAELRLHMRKHTGEKPFLCTECGQAFIQRSHLMEHIKIHSDERPYKCHLCDRAFKQSSSLKSHVQIHLGYKPYKCSQCPYACRQAYSLTQHMKQHSADLPQANRPHVCVICHKNFTTMAMLTSHSRCVHQAIF